MPAIPELAVSQTLLVVRTHAGREAGLALGDSLGVRVRREAEGAIK